MSIQDICYERLLNLHQPGGESTLFSDKKISLLFTKGGLFTDNTYLEGVITNLNLSSKAVLDPFCVEEGCVEGGGIWTTAVTTNISKDNNGVTEYWVSGSLDSNGNIWVLDLGIINSVTGDFIIKDKAVPIDANGYFKSKVLITQGIKLAVLKKVSYSQVIPVLHYFGKYKNNKLITRTKVGKLLTYNAEDQQSDLELLSIGLLNLIFSTYKHSEKNTVSFYKKGELDYNIKQILTDNLSAISELVDFTSISRRINSIPKTLTTYLTSELLYNDNLYTDNIARCVAEDCIDSECIETKPVFITSSREVSTRAIAWFYLLVYSYSLYLNNNDYTYLLDLLAFYLVNQINNKKGLPTKGWSHSDNLLNSTEIIEYDLSTSVMVYIVLLKHYDYTINSYYLELATNIEESIWENFYNFNFNLFNQDDIGELSYSLLFANLVNRSDVVESILSYIESNLTVDYGIIKESLDGINIINLNKLSSDNLANYPFDLNYTSLNNLEYDLLDISKVNLLLLYSITLSQLNKYSISTKLEQYINTFLDTLNNVEITNILPYVCSCISETSIFSLEVIVKGDYYLTSNLSFERVLILQKLINLPIEFGWFSKKALQFTGNLYKILYSVSKFLSTFSVSGKDLITNNYLKSLKGFRLQNYLSNFNWSRLPQELDSQVKDEYSFILGGQENKITNKGVINFLNRYGILSKIYEPYNSILKLNSINNITTLGENYIIGNDYASTNIVEITTNQPTSLTLDKEILKSLPIATKLNLENVITLNTDISNNFSCLLFKEEIENGYLLLEPSLESTILQENGEDILDEVGFAIAPESGIGTVSNGYLLKEDEFKFKLEG